VRVASLLLAAVALAACALLGGPLSPELRSDLDLLRGAAPGEIGAYALAESLVTEVGPRFAGSPGDGRAVRWALRTLTALGFRNVHAEPVTVPHWERGAIVVEMRAPYAQRFEAVALGGSVATPRDGIEAEVLVVASPDELEKLPAAAVQGRIVYFGGRTERTSDGTGYNRAVPARRQGPAVAARKGARAVLIRSIGTGAHRFAHTGATKYEEGTRRIPAAALSAPDADLLERALRSAPVRVRVALSARDRGEARSANVIGEIPGVTDEIVLLGAHLDSWDVTPGANDDAAGVGIVIAAAQRLARLGKPYRTIRVVLFANEEFGVSGGKAYVRAHAAELGRHAVVMEADSGSGPVFRLNGDVAEADWPLVEALAAELRLEAGLNGKDGGVDVGELRKQGVPELQAAQDAGVYFDVHHTADDTVDKLDREGLAQATGVFAALAHVASEDAPGLRRLAVARTASPAGK
jgi:hypothetical protein